MIDNLKYRGTIFVLRKSKVDTVYLLSIAKHSDLSEERRVAA